MIRLEQAGEPQLQFLLPNINIIPVTGGGKEYTLKMDKKNHRTGVPVTERQVLLCLTRPDGSLIVWPIVGNNSASGFVNS